MPIKRIPTGHAGFQTLTEAVTTEYGQLIELVRQAVREKLRTTVAVQPGLMPGVSSDHYCDLQGMFADRAVVRLAGRLWAFPYTVADGDVITVGDPVPVAVNYVPLREAAAAAADDATATFREAADGSIEVTIIRAGTSANGNVYGDALLRDAVPLFEGVRVFVKSDAEHTQGSGKDVRNLVGGIYGVRFVEGAQPDTGRLVGTLRPIDPTDPVVVKMTEAVRRGLAGLMGLSIDAEASVRREKRGARTVRVAQRFVKVNSVDLIVEPGAGGGLDRLTEATATDDDTRSFNEEDAMKNRYLLALAAIAPALAAAVPADAPNGQVLVKLHEACVAQKLDYAVVLDAADKAKGDDEAKLTAAITEAVGRLVEAAKAAATAAGAQAVREAAAQKTGDDAPLTRGELLQHQARLYAVSAIAASTLPQAAKDKLQADFRSRERFTEANVDSAITAEREYLARFVESGRPTGGMPRIEVGDRTKVIADMLDAFFDEKHKDHGVMMSFRECYAEITGDRYVTGIVDRTRLTESIGTDTFAQALGNSLTRRMQAVYRDQVAYDAWRAVCVTTPVRDFRTQERTQIGGFGDLPTVAERGPYTAFSDPSDDAATYAVVKRGGKVEITMEAIKNDDVGAIRRVPMELGRAAKRTLFKFVFEFFRANPTIYDGTALYHASRNNLFSAALSGAQVSAHRLAMKKQVGRDTATRMGIGPRFLLVPDDLEETAVDLFRRNTNNDKTFQQSLSMDIITVPTWTDANDWVTVADPLDIPVLEIGFLDGQEEPMLLAQDQATEGQVFTNDIISWKIRHIYGGNVLVDGAKGTTKAVVA